MASDHFTSQEKDIVKQCLDFVINGNAFKQVEFEMLFGVSLLEAKEIAQNYPYIDEYDERSFGIDNSWLFIHNVFVNLLNSDGKLLKDFSSVTLEQLEKIFVNWKK